MPPDAEDTMKILCVFTRILGGKTFSRRLDDVLEIYPGLLCEHIDFEDADYQRYTPPFYAQYSNSIEAADRIRYKMKNSGRHIGDYDVLFFQSFHLTPPFKKYIEQMPTIIALDSTPRLAHRGNVKAYGVRALMKSMIAPFLDFMWFSPIFRSTDFFLARTEAVRNSLELDYGVQKDRIRVTYSPMDIAERRHPVLINRRPKIIFVGNNFERKGGPFLLSLYKKYLKEKSDLIVVSRDPGLLDSGWPDGVTFIPGLPHEEVISLYKDCDIFAMPTWKDEMGIVICEAMAAGLPVVARDATAQHELIDDGVSGYLMPYESSEEDWAAKLLSLVENPQLRNTMGENGRLKAVALFSQQSFEQKVSDALAAVGAIQS